MSDCSNCENRGRVNGLSQETFCDGCVYNGSSWKKDHFKAKEVNDITQAQLIEELRRVAKEMIDLGAKMDYFGGFDAEIADKGRELLGAGMIAQQWAEEIEKCDQ